METPGVDFTVAMFIFIYNIGCYGLVARDANDNNHNNLT